MGVPPVPLFSRSMGRGSGSEAAAPGGAEVAAVARGAAAKIEAEGSPEKPPGFAACPFLEPATTRKSLQEKRTG